MVNEALTYQWDKQGTYELSAEINGKASWKSATQAIWYNSTFKNWMIGALSKNEDVFRGITSIDNLEYDCPQQVGNHHWKYHYGNDSLKSCSKDVTIQCTGTSKWKLGFKCDHSELDPGTSKGNVFEENNGYNFSFAKTTCHLACDAREDCKYAEMYYAGTENQSCFLHGNLCSNWRSTQHPLTAVYVKGNYLSS